MVTSSLCNAFAWIKILFSYSAFTCQIMPWRLKLKKLFSCSLEPEQEALQLVELYIEKHIYISFSLSQIVLIFKNNVLWVKGILKKQLQRLNAFLLSSLFDDKTWYRRNIRNKNCTSQYCVLCFPLYSFVLLSPGCILSNPLSLQLARNG